MALDPADQHLRHVEKDVLIPKIMREKARERCSEQVQVCKEFGTRSLTMLTGQNLSFLTVWAHFLLMEEELLPNIWEQVIRRQKWNCSGVKRQQHSF
ncbi:COX assembly mitochondrial protein homolog isoform X2 [Saccopteryx leptura]|uniref:COX assembly mitochondrial protein homolog isoform X2 n=1 Tax=Saccopteryx leptura TaxID=249018 RepID=UPI00339CB237